MTRRGPLPTPPSTALDAFTRAIALDPGFGPAYEHMPALLLSLGRPEEARRAAATYLSLDPTSPHRGETRLAALLLDTTGIGRAEAERMLDTASVFTVWLAVFQQGLASWPDTAETAIRLLRRLGEPGRGAGGGLPWVLDSVMWPQYLAQALAFRGHLREAFAVDERLLRQPSASPWSWFLDPFLDLSLLGIVPDSLARATFGRSLEAAAAWATLHSPSLEGTALVAVARRHGRPGTLRRPGGSHGAGTRRPRAWPCGLGCSERRVSRSSIWHGGIPVAAIRKLSAIPDTLCLADEYTANCFHLNLTLARLLAARGDDRRAGALLERWRWSGGSTPSFVLATLELGRIAERLGDTRKAAECYGFVMAAWHRPDRELLPYVAEAREGLARLRVE